MANSKLEARNVNLATTDWAEIEEYAQRVGIRGVSAALRFMLNHRRILLAAQRAREAESKSQL